VAKSDEDKLRDMVEDLAQQERTSCPVCRLPDDVQRELAQAAQKGIKRRQQLEWLENEVGEHITYRALASLYARGHHERPGP